MNTRVKDLGSDREFTYSLPPEMAVVAAYEQSKGNWNTWTYLTPDEHPEFRVGQLSVSCGDFAAMVELKPYYLKATGDTTYDETGITYPVVHPVEWKKILRLASAVGIMPQFGWSNQPDVICFKVGDPQLKLIEKALHEALPWILRPVIAVCDFI